MSKCLNYTVEDRIKCEIKIRPVSSSYKKNFITAFRGFFMTNFKIPDYLGIGKAVSRGFGTVIKMRVLKTLPKSS